MRSRAEVRESGVAGMGGGARLGARLRVAGEWAAAGAGAGAARRSLALALGWGGKGAVERASTETLSEALVRWTTVAGPERVHVAFDHAPSLVERDWLAALVGAGRGGWSGPSLMPTALALEPRADPAGGVEVSVAAPPVRWWCFGIRWGLWTARGSRRWAECGPTSHGRGRCLMRR